MLVIAMCVVLALLGVAAVVRWGGLSLARSQLTARDGGAHDQRLALRTYALIALVSGAGGGLLAAGAGGRIVMRVLTITSPNTAEGQLTEAEATIGDITFAGTLGLLGFTSLFLGVLTGVLYLLLCRWLPTGRLGGLIFGDSCSCLRGLVWSRFVPAILTSTLWVRDGSQSCASRGSFCSTGWSSRR